MITAHPFLVAWGFSGWELAVLLLFGLLIFGRRLPELGRSVGKTIVEFKKGLAGIESDVNASGQNPALPPTSRVENASKEAATSQQQAPKN